MPKLLAFLALVMCWMPGFSQQLEKLTIEKIMRDPKWIGSSPSNLQWTNDGQFLYFNWNPEKAAADSLYYISSPISVFRQVASDGRRLFRANTTFYITDFLSNIATATGLPLVSEISEISNRCAG